MSRLSRKTVAWAAGTALVVGGAAAGIVVATHGGTQGRPPGAGAKPGALRLVSVAPGTGSTDVNGTTDIAVTYNQPPPATAPLPTLSPAIAGSWHRAGNAVVFTPATGFPPATRVTVTVPGAGDAAGRSGPAASSTTGSSTTGSSTTGSSTTRSFTTGKYSTLRLQQLLAQLGYLPLSWTQGPADGWSWGEPTAMSGSEEAAQLSAAYTPPAGTFRWAPGYPAQLRSFWSEGKPNTLDQGAITGFEADHKLPTDGVAGAKVWQELLAAAAKGQENTHGYSYAIASKSSPETLTIWHDGKKVFSSYANTGIGAAPTASGTFPVYEKLPYQVMSGTNPDGSHYADPVSWVSYFNGGDAVHYFPRGSFGFPQSLGCVELPYGAAKRAYPYLPYGTLVTVQ